MIEINNLVKKYKNVIILNISNFKFEKGKSYLIIGSNGSGKSTFIKCLLGINIVQDGQLIINTKNIGYVPEKCYFPEMCSVEKFLKNILLLYDKKTNEHLIDKYCDLFNINKKKYISKLSKGMMQKVLIIQSIIHDSDLYIFDEPLNGLDYKSQIIFFEIIDSLRKMKKTIIITTHYKEFYKNKYDYTLLIKDGDIISESD